MIKPNESFNGIVKDFDVQKYWQENEEEIDNRLLEIKLGSLSQELKYCKEDLKLRCPYLYSATLRNLEFLTSQAEDLLKCSEDLPNFPQRYQEELRELANNVKGTIKEVAVKAKEHSNTKEISPEYATIFKRTGQNAEIYLKNLMPIDLNKIAAINTENKVKGLHSKLTENMQQ